MTATRGDEAIRGDVTVERIDPVSAPFTGAGAGIGDTISHNLAGQKLGRKGRVTRERILAAALELIEGPAERPLSMTSVARRACLGMTSLYNYFSDLTELVLALLEPVMASSEDVYLARLRERWPERHLGQRSAEFIQAYHRFWAQNSRLLHLRNAMADARDPRMIQHRIESTLPIIQLLVEQMDGERRGSSADPASMATMAMVGIERSITVATDYELRRSAGWDVPWDDKRFVDAGARMLELAIADMRAQARQ